MDFDSAIVADEIDESEKDEILSFFQQDLALDILESSVFLDDNVSYEDTEDSGPRDKSKDVLNADTEQVYVGDEDYEHYAKQLERSTTGGLTLGVQDSVQSYLKSIGTVQLLTAAGEVAIAQRIEAASRLMVYGLCENPMTIRAMLDWYQQLLNDEIKLRYIVNLEVMYSSDAEQRKLAELSDALKSKGVDNIEELDDDELDDALVDSDDEEDEDEDLDQPTKDESTRSSSGVPIPVMEESLMPMILEAFEKIKRIFSRLEKLQKERMEILVKSAKPDEALEKKYAKSRCDLFEHVSKIRLNDDRIAEILEKLTARTALLMGLEGKLLRLATAAKVKREDF